MGGEGLLIVAVTLAVLALLLAAAAAVLAVVALRGQRRLRRAYRAVTRDGRDDVIALLERHAHEAAALRRDVDDAKGVAMQGLSRVAAIRYDAFPDTGGQMSFSVALLDEAGDGVVVSGINGRMEARTYAKPVVGAQSSQPLSDEEREVIARALHSEDHRHAVRAVT